MAFKITVEDPEEFEDRVKNGDIEVSLATVDTILKNLTGRKRFIHTLDIQFLSEGVTHNLTTDRRDFIDVLKIHLPIIEKYEYYEVCAKIVEAIDTLQHQNT